MKFRNALVMSTALLLVGVAHAQMPDLSGATLLISDGVCRLGEEEFACSLIEKQGTRYAVVREDTDEGMRVIAVLLVRAGAHLPYKTSDFTIIWSKDDEAVMTT
jgi:hypothetical protein